MHKDQAYFKLDRNDRLLALSGVPINYLKKPIIPEQLNFMPSSIAYSASNVTVIQSEYQKNFLTELLDNIEYIGEPSTYVIGSYPTDQAAYQLATLITKTYYEHILQHKIYPRIKWVDMGSPDWEFLKSDEGYSLVVIHGISESSSENRKIEHTKDFLRKATPTTRFVLAVTSNILSYAINKLEISPDGVFQLSKTTNRVVV